MEKLSLTNLFSNATLKTIKIYFPFVVCIGLTYWIVALQTTINVKEEKIIKLSEKVEKVQNDEILRLREENSYRAKENADNVKLLFELSEAANRRLAIEQQRQKDN